ncbi:MAG: hypothetical protein JXR78_00615 [Victivallales bacterium]|nr:hypothetical protein [Victivallales bacterium]
MAEARQRLLANVDVFRNVMRAAGLDTGGSFTQIVPLGKARIRISLNACHTTEDIAFLIDKLIAAVRAED